MPRLFGGLRTVLLAGLIALPAPLAWAVETLSGPEIQSLFDGATVAGNYYDGRGEFTEYHHADGHAYGHNGRQINTDGCWAVVGDHICYYYGPPDKRTTHCFTVHKTDRLYVLRTRESGRINALATVVPGNGAKHSDNGKPWVCDGLVSHLRTIRPASWNGTKAPLPAR
jgi:hypothetical protein